MSLTMTIKNVPDEVAERLRSRAAANHRSLQGELMWIIDHAASAEADGVREPSRPVYRADSGDKTTGRRHSRVGIARDATGKLTLDQLWQRARKLGASMPGESVAIVRRDRDARRR